MRTILGWTAALLASALLGAAAYKVVLDVPQAPVGAVTAVDSGQPQATIEPAGTGTTPGGSPSASPVAVAEGSPGTTAPPATQPSPTPRASANTPAPASGPTPAATRSATDDEDDDDNGHQRRNRNRNGSDDNSGSGHSGSRDDDDSSGSGRSGSGHDDDSSGSGRSGSDDY